MKQQKLTRAQKVALGRQKPAQSDYEKKQIKLRTTILGGH
jgi:hypothetical protein